MQPSALLEFAHDIAHCSPSGVAMDIDQNAAVRYHIQGFIKSGDAVSLALETFGRKGLQFLKRMFAYASRSCGQPFNRRIMHKHELARLASLNVELNHRRTLLDSREKRFRRVAREALHISLMRTQSTDGKFYRTSVRNRSADRATYPDSTREVYRLINLPPPFPLFRIRHLVALQGAADDIEVLDVERIDTVRNIYVLKSYVADGIFGISPDPPRKRCRSLNVSDAYPLKLRILRIARINAAEVTAFNLHSVKGDAFEVHSFAALAPTGHHTYRCTRIVYFKILQNGITHYSVTNTDSHRITGRGQAAV